MPDPAATPERRQIALFPLGLVQFPGQPLELQVFEPRYLALLDDLDGADPQEFGVVAISSGHEVGEENLHRIADVGCAVQIELTRQAGGRVLLRAHGTWRFDHIEVVDGGRPYLTAQVRPLPDIPPGDPDVRAADSVRSALSAYAAAAELELGVVPADPEELGWWLAAGGPFTRTEQLSALRAGRTERLDLLARWLRREARLLHSTGSIPFHGDRHASTN